MKKFLGFEDHEAARTPRRLILFNHIPKTGGTTLAYVLKQALDVTLYPLYRRYGPAPAYEDGDSAYIPLEDYRDWARLYDHESLKKAPNILLEGNVWGAENLLPEGQRAFYVTQLRDPFLVCRSNYSYLIRHKNFVDSDFETFLRTSWHPNFLTQHLASGDLQLALDRIRNTYALFGITEHFKETVRLFAGFFNFDISSYTERNKSFSEQYEIPDRARARFWQANKDDEYLYKTAEEIFMQRISTAEFLADVPAAKEISEERSEASYRANPYQGQEVADLIQKSLREKNYAEAARLIEGRPSAPIGDFLTLGKCYEELGDLEKAKAAYLEAFDWRASENIGPVSNFMFEHFPEELIEIAEREIAVLEDLIFDDPTDTFTYHNLVAYTDYLSSAYIKTGRPEDAAILIDRELTRMKRRGLCKGIGGHYDACYNVLMLRKAEALDHNKPQDAKDVRQDALRLASETGSMQHWPWRQIARHALVRGAPVLAKRAIKRLIRAF